MELSIDVGTITLPGIGTVSWSVFVGGVILFAMYRRSAMP